MFRFAHPLFLYGLLLIPLFTAGYWLLCRQQKKRIARLGNPELMAALMPDVSKKRRHVKFALMMLILGLLIVMLARPQNGTKKAEYKNQGIEAVVAIDVSNSMLCEDVKPSRLEKAQMIAGKVTENLDNDRIGLVAFAGNAITILPLTNDNVSAKLFLDDLNTSSVTVQGTDVADAIRRACSNFSDNESVGKALILFTDAEDHEEQALAAARKAHTDIPNLRIFVLSVGTANGGLIPLPGGEYKTDDTGKEVVTRLNESVGKEIAQAGNGLYIHVNQSDQAEKRLLQEISQMQTVEYTSDLYAEYDEQFVAVAILLILTIIAEVCIGERRHKFLSTLKLFKKS